MYTLFLYKRISALHVSGAIALDRAKSVRVD
jgi:hypothetical protein